MKESKKQGSKSEIYTYVPKKKRNFIQLTGKYAKYCMNSHF